MPRQTKKSTKAQSKSHQKAPSSSSDTPKKAKNTKKEATGSQAHIDEDEKRIRKLLRSKGLDLYDVTGDGNCLFRALSHQLFDSEIHHRDIRQTVQMNYIREHEDDFAPFLEDDEPWERYIRRMSKEGQWAGNIELVAAARVFEARIVIHQADEMHWEIQCGDRKPTRELHVVYIGGEHYDSVKKLEPGVYDDNDEQTIQDSETHRSPSSEEKMIMSSTGCTSIITVRKLLKQMNQDTGRVIEYLLEHKDNDVENKEKEAQENATLRQEKSSSMTSSKFGVGSSLIHEYAETKGIKGQGPGRSLSNKQKRKIAKLIQDKGFTSEKPTTESAKISQEFSTLSI